MHNQFNLLQKERMKTIKGRYGRSYLRERAKWKKPIVFLHHSGGRLELFVYFFWRGVDSSYYDRLGDVVVFDTTDR